MQLRIIRLSYCGLPAQLIVRNSEINLPTRFQTIKLRSLHYNCPVEIENLMG